MLAEAVPFPDRLSAMNDAEISAVGTTEPSALAELLETETVELLGVLGDDGDRTVPFFAMQHTAAGVGGVLLGELLVHGMDLAAAVGAPWSIRPDQALAITRGLLPSVPNSVDAAVAARATGTYHLHLRGGDHWTIAVRDGRVAIEAGRPWRADLHVSAEPVAFLLVGYQRMSRGRAALAGRMVAWGRRPWLAIPFGKLFVET